MSKEEYVMRCGKCLGLRTFGTWWLNPDEVKRVDGYRTSIDIPANRWCKKCINDYYLIPKNHLSIECKECGHTIKEMDICGYKQSRGEICDNPYCRRCIENPWVFDRT